jgi:hypothetical protein
MMAGAAPPLGAVLAAFLAAIAAPAWASSGPAQRPAAGRLAQGTTVAPGRLNTLRDVDAALQSCWIPPPVAESRPGMRITVRLSFNRAGEIIGAPRLTYVSRDATPEMKERYRRAIFDALERCTPLPFSPTLGEAIAGRIHIIHYVDHRNLIQAGTIP